MQYPSVYSWSSYLWRKEVVLIDRHNFWKFHAVLIRWEQLWQCSNSLDVVFLVMMWIHCFYDHWGKLAKMPTMLKFVNLTNSISIYSIERHITILSYLIHQQTTNSMLIILNFSYHSQLLISLITSLTLKIPVMGQITFGLISNQNRKSLAEKWFQITNHLTVDFFHNLL